MARQLVSSLNEPLELVNIEDIFTLVPELFKRSLWRWSPKKKDYRAVEQHNLSIPDAGRMKTFEQQYIPIVSQKLAPKTRHEILALAISACQHTNIPVVLSAFPSAELLEIFMHEFLQSHKAQHDTWFHVTTFNPSVASIELVAAIVAAGTMTTTCRAFQNFGLALQEVVRVVLPRNFEADNTLTRDLQLLQAWALQVQIGLWSGDKRKMEMAESFQPLLLHVVNLLAR
ncbi:hypothetical protein K469DRAFT_55366 [Zopfia rhizophila CBS 207.26]|uniref:Transcription factor domain-containing protein n=1 Tax=Zopfia rhizophila CBS 207.26 TaxID=1314779 RepID=A0A6A6D9H1_9PEZI|nr:hypothetical protein K469DRAFT_55366 [Zopfia rhizophila CBS 207.26]